jgi:hypothetical protein
MTKSENRACPGRLAPARGRPGPEGHHRPTRTGPGRDRAVAGEDRYNYSREYLLARLAVLLGGRAAEDLVLGDITTGAENDLVEATHLARRMVTRWGWARRCSKKKPSPRTS